MVSAGSGYDKYGRYDWLMTPGQYQKHLALMRICKERTGHVPDLTPGYSAYRPFNIQVIYKNDLGIGAAIAGTSSHGGKWAGPVTGWRVVPTMAMDYHNWYLVFKNDRNAWYQAVRDAGLVPGQITVSAFGADEPWHVIDLDPWRAVTAGDGSVPFPTPGEVPTSTPAIMEEDMIYISGTTRPAALVTLGRARVLNSDEERQQAKVLATKVLEGNDRQYDLWMSFVTSSQEYTRESGPFIASSPNRGKAIFDVGVYRLLNAEESQNAGAFTNRVYSMNDRQYDLAQSIATTGIASPFPITIPEVKFDYDALAKHIVENLPETAEGPSVDAIAKAVRAEFAENPLT